MTTFARSSFGLGERAGGMLGVRWAFDELRLHFHGPACIRLHELAQFCSTHFILALADELRLHFHGPACIRLHELARFCSTHFILAVAYPVISTSQGGMEYAVTLRIEPFPSASPISQRNYCLIVSREMLVFLPIKRGPSRFPSGMLDRHLNPHLKPQIRTFYIMCRFSERVHNCGHYHKSCNPCGKRRRPKKYAPLGIQQLQSRRNPPIMVSLGVIKRTH